MAKLIMVSAFILGAFNLVSCTAIPNTSVTSAVLPEVTSNVKVPDQSYGQFGHCNTDDMQSTPPILSSDVQTCIRYLKGLKLTEYEATSKVTQICEEGTASVWVESYGVPKSSSYCSDIAGGVEFIWTDCGTGVHREYIHSGGSFAHGNGNIKVHLVSSAAPMA